MMEKLRPNNLLSKRDEERLVEAGRRVLLNGGYPNPERVGCPGSDVLKAVALRKMPLIEAADFIDHLGMCSPCFLEYTAFQERAAKRKKLEFALAGAALLIILGVGGWLWKAKRGHEVPSQPVAMTLDLRNWIVPRGEETTGPNSGPIKLPRARLELKIFLAMGSPTGSYEVQVSTELEKPLMKVAGNATIENGIALMEAKIDLSKIDSGNYVLSIGKVGMESRSYPLVVK